MQISAVDLLANLMKEKTTSLIVLIRLSVVVVVKELPGQRVRHIGDDCLVVGHAGDSKNWKYAKQCQTFIFINYIHSTHPQKYFHFLIIF